MIKLNPHQLECKIIKNNQNKHSKPSHKNLFGYVIKKEAKLDIAQRFITGWLKKIRKNK
jgi:hypothetical protein